MRSRLLSPLLVLVPPFSRVVHSYTGRGRWYTSTTLQSSISHTTVVSIFTAMATPNLKNSSLLSSPKLDCRHVSGPANRPPPAASGWDADDPRIY
jgi:hypothetical protein